MAASVILRSRFVASSTPTAKSKRGWTEERVLRPKLRSYLFGRSSTTRNAITLPGSSILPSFAPMRDVLRRDLTAALKARDRNSIAALRSALAAIENAEAPSTDDLPAPRPQIGPASTEASRLLLTEVQIHAIVQAEVDERTAAAAHYERIGQNDHAERLRAEADVIRRYLRPGPPLT